MGQCSTCWSQWYMVCVWGGHVGQCSTCWSQWYIVCVWGVTWVSAVLVEASGTWCVCVWGGGSRGSVQYLLKPVVHGVCVCVGGVTWVSAVLVEASGTWCVCVWGVTWVSAVLVEASGVCVGGWSHGSVQCLLKPVVHGMCVGRSHGSVQCLLKPVCSSQWHMVCVCVCWRQWHMLCVPQGVGPTAQRAAVVAGVELPAYDLCKKHIIRSGFLGDTKETHFLWVFTCTWTF